MNPLTTDEMVRVSITLMRNGHLNIKYERQESITDPVCHTLAAGMLAQVMGSFNLVENKPKEGK